MFNLCYLVLNLIKLIFNLSIRFIGKIRCIFNINKIQKFAFPQGRIFCDWVISRVFISYRKNKLLQKNNSTAKIVIELETFLTSETLITMGTFLSKLFIKITSAKDTFHYRGFC